MDLIDVSGTEAINKGTIKQKVGNEWPVSLLDENDRVANSGQIRTCPPPSVLPDNLSHELPQKTVPRGVIVLVDHTKKKWHHRQSTLAIFLEVRNPYFDFDCWCFCLKLNANLPQASRPRSSTRGPLDAPDE